MAFISSADINRLLVFNVFRRCALIMNFNKFLLLAFIIFIIGIITLYSGVNRAPFNGAKPKIGPNQEKCSFLIINNTKNDIATNDKIWHI